MLEALASGTPLVATPAGGIGSVVDDERHGLIVPERDAARAGGGDRAACCAIPRRARASGRPAARSSRRVSGGTRAAARFEAAYDRALAFKSLTR